MLCPKYMLAGIVAAVLAVPACSQDDPTRAAEAYCTKVARGAGIAASMKANGFSEARTARKLKDAADGDQALAWAYREAVRRAYHEPEKAEVGHPDYYGARWLECVQGQAAGG